MRYIGSIVIMIGTLSANGCRKTSTIETETRSDLVSTRRPTDVNHRGANGDFVFPADGTGKLLAERLPPTEKLGPLPGDRPPIASSAAPPGVLEQIAFPLPHGAAEPPTTDPSLATTAARRLGSVPPEQLPVEAWAGPPSPGPQTIVVVPPVHWPAPDLRNPLPMPPLSTGPVPAKDLGAVGLRISARAALARIFVGPPRPESLAPTRGRPISPRLGAELPETGQPEAGTPRLPEKR